MSFLDKVKNMVNVSEDDYYDELENDEFRETPEQEQADEPEEPRRSSRRAREREPREQRDNVVNIHTTAQLQVVLTKPEVFDGEVKNIADHLNEKRTVLLNLEATNQENARRLVDFLSGVAYANGGEIQRVANRTYIITPYNVQMQGNLLDELESNGIYF